MLDCAYRLSLSLSYFTEVCERLIQKFVFSKLKYPQHLVDSTVKIFLNWSNALVICFPHPPTPGDRGDIWGNY